MKKNDNLIFTVLLVAVFFALIATFSVLSPIKIELNNGISLNISTTDYLQTTEPIVTTPVVTQPAVTEQADTNLPSEEASSESSIPQSYEEILFKYTEVMDKAKADSPAFKKIWWQAIPVEKAQFDGRIFDKLLPLASNFFQTEEEARSNPEMKAKGESMEWFPIYHNARGCMLTDTSAIESASCTELSDGNIKIVIELKDEFNSEPPVDAPTCDSYIGSLFTPIQFASIRDVLENDATVKFIVKDAAFDLTYYDCVAELTYNPATNEIVELSQVMHLNIDITNGTIFGISAKGHAVLDNYSYFSDFQY